MSSISTAVTTFISKILFFPKLLQRQQEKELNRNNKMTTISNLTAIAMAQRQSFDPWSLPDDFTVFAFAPENVRTFLHPHWKTQQAVHPLWSYFFGLYYFVMGILITFKMFR